MSPKQQLKSAIGLINAGIKRLEKGQWCQGKEVQYDQNGAKHIAYCATGLTRRTPEAVRRDVGIRWHAEELIAQGIQKVTPHARKAGLSHAGRIINWNDTKGRTRGQVKRAFQWAAKLGQAKLAEL